MSSCGRARGSQPGRPLAQRAAAFAALGSLCLLAFVAERAGAVRRLTSASFLRAHSSHALKASDTAHLHFVSAEGSLLHEVGQATGTIPGSMKVHFSLGTTMRGSFIIYTRYGSISGHGEATPHGSGVIESFAGSLEVTGGTGRYGRARGKASLTGTFNRRNYALVVQTAGTLSY